MALDACRYHAHPVDTPSYTTGSLACGNEVPPCPPLSCPRGSALSGFTARAPTHFTDRYGLRCLPGTRSAGATGSSARWCGRSQRSLPLQPTGRRLLRRRKWQRDNALTAGTVMDRTRTPLSIWFWAAYLVSSHTPGISGRPIPAPAWLEPLRDGVPDPRQTAARRSCRTTGRDFASEWPAARSSARCDASWVDVHGRAARTAAVAMIKAS